MPRPFALALGILAALGATATAHAETPDEEPPTVPPAVAPAPAAPAPSSKGTTVVAPPGSGVTVIAPTAGGGTVTASGCAAVQVEGSDTVVKSADGSVADVACKPYAAPDPVPRIIFVESRPRFASDPGRGALITLGAVGQALGSLVLGAWYANAMEREASDCRYKNYDYRSYESYTAKRDACGSAGAWGPLALYTATMAFAPTLATFKVGATTRGWVFASTIATSIAIGKALDWHDKQDGWDGVGLGGAVFGFILPATLGIVALATTPHAEDLAPEKPSLQHLSVAPVGDKQHGLTGASVGLGGTF